MNAATAEVAGLFEEHRAHLWALAYRLLGTASDADETVQETFTRLLERPPARTDQPLLPWLVRVAANLARDELRRRQRRGYTGPWLPSPVPDERLAWTGVDAPDARYQLRESASLAFLLALEALTPTQRAVLVLRDVFDHSVRETAELLDLTEANVKTTLHRARRAMQGYEAKRVQVDDERVKDVLGRFLAALGAGDVQGVLALLADDVTAIADGAGEFVAAKKPIVGAERVAALYVGLARKGSGPAARVELRSLNGVSSILLDADQRLEGWAPRVALQLELDAAGKVRTIYSVVATSKLGAVFPT